MTSVWVRRTALIALYSGFLVSVVGAQPADVASGVTRYRVTVALRPGDDLDRVISQLAGSYRLRVEPNAEEGVSGFVMSASEASARMLSRDGRVASLEVLPESAAAPPRPGAVASNAIPGLGAYSYDGSGNITAAGDHTFHYDRMSRVKKATLGSATEEYTYDRYGNILTMTTNGGAARTFGVKDTTNRLTEQQTPQGAWYDIRATYDGRGNMLSNSANDTFVPDGTNMLAESTIGSVRKLYLYTAGDERIAVVTMAGSTPSRWDWTVRDPSGRPLRRYATSPSSVWSWEEDYVYRDGQLLAAEVPRADKTIHFHLDHLGTPRLITGNGGAEISQHTYYPFGAELTSAAQDPEVLKFTGHERDAVSLDYMHARYYNALMGRFLSVDPGKDWDPHKPQSWNMYAYVQNNPINATDPTGMNIFKALWDWAVGLVVPEKPENDRAQQAQQLADDPAAGVTQAEANSQKASTYRDGLKEGVTTVGAALTEEAVFSVAIGFGVRNIRVIESGRLRGFTRFNSQSVGGEVGARSLFEKLAGRAPAGAFDRVVLANGTEVLFRLESRSAVPKVEVISVVEKTLEKISFGD